MSELPSGADDADSLPDELPLSDLGEDEFDPFGIGDVDAEPLACDTDARNEPSSLEEGRAAALFYCVLST